jgi:hypothetical protein
LCQPLGTFVHRKACFDIMGLVSKLINNVKW